MNLVKTLKSTTVTTANETELIVLAPSFDHALKDPVPDDILLSSRTRLVIIEGNYTLLKRSPWDQIANTCDERCVRRALLSLGPWLTFSRWLVDAPIAVVKERLAQRHLAAGIETSAAAAAKRAEENDIPNGELIRSLLVTPDVIIEN